MFDAIVPRSSREAAPSAGEEIQELDVRMTTVAASEALHDTLRAERTFAFQVPVIICCRLQPCGETSWGAARSAAGGCSLKVSATGTACL